MSERTSGPWKWHSRIEDLHGNGPIQTGSIYAEPTIGHAYSVAVAPKYQTEVRWKADAAAIVMWEANFDDLVKALDEIECQAVYEPLVGEKEVRRMLNHCRELAAAALAKAKS